MVCFFILLHVLFSLFVFLQGKNGARGFAHAQHSNLALLPSSPTLFCPYFKRELIWGDVLREGNKGGESNQSSFTLV